MAAAVNMLHHLVARQSMDGDVEMVAPACDVGNDYDGRMGVRISAVFVILIGSTFGALFPVLAKRNRHLGMPDWAFFIAKYFGSGVIIATAFIHLLAPANEALGDPCLTGPITEYSWVEGIALMTVFLMFFLELMVMRYGKFGPDASTHSHSHSPSTDAEVALKRETASEDEIQHVPGQDHLGHAREHVDNFEREPDFAVNTLLPETYSAQLTAVFILEFGVIFHSVFIGLTLAVAGSEFTTLYIVLVFHQTFEGLGLGSRLAMVPWPQGTTSTPYYLAIAYGLATPIAIAIGLGVRNTYPPNSSTTLIVNGVFDSISAGILIYTGLVELMAHEFMFSPYMQKGPVKRMMAAFGLMCAGAGLMALLGKWA